MNPGNYTWQKSLLTNKVKIKDVIQNLTETSLRIVLVINDDNKFEGTISDGDIRRGLLKGLGLNSPIINLIQKNALVVSPSLDLDSVKQLMAVNKILQIPILDENHFIVGLHSWDDINNPTKRLNSMVIMAGGKGTRLMPHTENCPKPLVSVAGKPMLEHIIERANNNGFENFIISIHYLGEMIEEYFGNGSNLGVKIKYLKESEPLGTAGALSLLNPKPDLPFIVTNGDVLTDINYGDIIDFHNKHDAVATMAVRSHEWQHPFGVVYTNGVNIVDIKEKPISKNYINAGVYSLSPGIISEIIPNTFYNMTTLFEDLQKKSKKIVAYPMHEPWMDVGRPEDLEIANKFI